MLIARKKGAKVAENKKSVAAKEPRAPKIINPRKTVQF